MKKTKDEGSLKVEKKPKSKRNCKVKRLHTFILHTFILQLTEPPNSSSTANKPAPIADIRLKSLTPADNLIGEVGQGNRKDIRNAVEAARGAADKWAKTTGHSRAQILYYLGENLAARSDDFAKRISQQTGVDMDSANQEVEASIAALFTAAAWADKYDGAVHNTPIRNVTIAVPEAIGVMGILLPDDHSLLALCTLAASALAMGNVLVVVPSQTSPLTATDFYQVLETSDVPAGTFNIVTGGRDELAKTLSEHDDVDVVWYAGSPEGQKAVQIASIGNMKQTWVMPVTGELPEMDEILRHSTQVKNIWVPYGG